MEAGHRKRQIQAVRRTGMPPVLTPAARQIHCVGVGVAMEPLYSAVHVQEDEGLLV